MPLPLPLPGDYEDLQGYLNIATDGIAANFAEVMQGGKGENVTICDIEYSWNLNHEDLPAVATWISTGSVPSDPIVPPSDHHGTAVLGEIASLNNNWGTTGAAFEADIAVAPCFLDGVYNLHDAMTTAIANLQAGDVIIIEQQTVGPNYTGVPPTTQFGLVPVEWREVIFNDILTAIGNGIHVVEAGCNGSQDLDDAVYQQGNGDHWPFMPADTSVAWPTSSPLVGWPVDM